MAASVLVAGLDGRSLALEAPVLQRERHAILEVESGRALVEEIVRHGARLLVLGPRLPDLDLPEAIRRVRASALARHVSILALLPAGEPPEMETEIASAGANAVMLVFGTLPIGLSFILTQYAQGVLHYSALEFGLASVVMPVTLKLRETP